jgi:hypothetical protein
MTGLLSQFDPLSSAPVSVTITVSASPNGGSRLYLPLVISKINKDGIVL